MNSRDRITAFNHSLAQAKQHALKILHDLLDECHDPDLRRQIIATILSAKPLTRRATRRPPPPRPRPPHRDAPIDDPSDPDGFAAGSIRLVPSDYAPPSGGPATLRPLPHPFGRTLA